MQASQYQDMFANENTHWWFVAKRSFARTFIKEIGLDKKSKILDLGCGTGGMTSFLGQFGQVIGVEQNDEAVGFCKQRQLKVIRSSINKIPVSEKIFDLITIFDVLYHKGVREGLVLKEVNRLMKDKGYLLVTDCALPFFWSLHDEQMMAKKRFKKKELENLLLHNNFEIIRSTYIYFATFPLFALQRIILKVFKPSQVRTVNKVNSVLNWMLSLLVKTDLFLLEKNISLPIGSSLMILARRK